MNKVIDISSWQDATTPEIDFTAVKDSGIVGVMVKFTQGTDYVNPKARTNLQRAKTVGLLVGAYHVAELDKAPADVQAEYFLRSLDGLTLDLATALDVESLDGIMYQTSKEWIETFLAAVKDRSPATLLYVDESNYNQLAGAPFGYKLWAAQFTPANAPAPFMVQEPATEVKGINGAVDVSVLSKVRTVNSPNPASKVQLAAAIRTPVLREGDTGTEVKLLQTLLVHHGIAVAVDGDYGVNTVEAVRSFQASHFIAIDGIVGKATWEALAPVKALPEVPAATAEAPAATAEVPGDSTAEAPAASTAEAPAGVIAAQY